MLNDCKTMRLCLLAIMPPLFLGQLAACQPEPHEELLGSLYFATGPYLARLDLRSGEVGIETNLGDAEIQQISWQRGQRLLLTVFGKVLQRDRHRLVLYDLATRQALTIATGRNGHYLPGTEILLYVDEVSLTLAERDKGGWHKTEVLRHPVNAMPLVTPVSSTRFLYAPAGGAIHVYDVESRQALELPALNEQCRLDAALWMMQRERLLCRRQLGSDRFDYAMVELDGSVAEVLELPESRKMHPVAFLSDQDVLILTEQWRSALSNRQNHAIWVYRLDNGDFYRLVDNQHLGRSVVYAPP